MEENIVNEKNNIQEGNKRMGIASFVLGLLSLVLAMLMPKFCLICAIVSIIFSVISKKGSLATAGMVLGIIGAVISFMFVCIEMDIDTEHNLNDSINNNEIVIEEKDPRSKVIGTWYGADDLTSLENGDYTIVFILDEDYNFTWGKYGDLDKNYVKGTYTFEDLHKTNYGKNCSYYRVVITGDEFYINGVLQDEPYGNTYEMGVVNDEISGVILSEITGSMYFLQKAE